MRPGAGRVEWIWVGVGQSPTFGAASLVARAALPAVFLAAVPVALALLRAGLFATFLVVRLVDFFAALAVSSAVLVACVRVVRALAAVVAAVLPARRAARASIVSAMAET